MIQILIKRLTLKDVDSVYNLCKKNTTYYKHCPPFITKEGVIEDMQALPPGKSLKDKFFLGFYQDGDLIAIIDLIRKYPSEEYCYIGLFMMDVEQQGRGKGSYIIEELCKKLETKGYTFLRLAWMKSNKVAESFWKKNGFKEKVVKEKLIIAEKQIGGFYHEDFQ